MRGHCDRVGCNRLSTHGVVDMNNNITTHLCTDCYLNEYHKNPNRNPLQ